MNVPSEPATEQSGEVLDVVFSELASELTQNGAFAYQADREIESSVCRIFYDNVANQAAVSTWTPQRNK